jgi:hypothetical protein
LFLTDSCFNRENMDFHFKTSIFSWFNLLTCLVLHYEYRECYNEFEVTWQLCNLLQVQHFVVHQQHASLDWKNNTIKLHRNSGHLTRKFQSF